MSLNEPAAHWINTAVDACQAFGGTGKKKGLLRAEDVDGLLAALGATPAALTAAAAEAALRQRAAKGGGAPLEEVLGAVLQESEAPESAARDPAAPTLWPVFERVFEPDGHMLGRAAVRKGLQELLPELTREDAEHARDRICGRHPYVDHDRFAAALASL